MESGADCFSEIVGTSLQSLGKDCLSICQQREPFLHILSRCYTFINLVTEFRKSLIFELTPLYFDCQRSIPLGSSKVLIISPLISQMKSQIGDLVGREQKAARITDRTEASVSLTDVHVVNALEHNQSAYQSCFVMRQQLAQSMKTMKCNGQASMQKL